MEEDAEGAALRQAAWEVYGVGPVDFVATRTRWVKELRARKQRDAAASVAALRKPSVAAAAINALLRAQDPVVDRLRDVGSRLRHAQSAMDVEGLAALRSERDAVLHDWVQAARTHAAGPLTAAVETEVRDTGVAALADGAATDVVLSGTLTRSLSYSGFGEVDVSDAVARTSTGVVLTRIEGGGGEDAADTATTDEDRTDEDRSDENASDLATKGRLVAVQEALSEAEDQVSAARQERRSRLEAAEVAAARATEAQDGLARARELLARAEREAEQAQAEDDRARAALELADAALAAARERRTQARTAVEEAQDAD